MGVSTYLEPPGPTPNFTVVPAGPAAPLVTVHPAAMPPASSVFARQEALLGATVYQVPELRRTDVATMVRGYPTEVSRHFHKDVGLTLTEYRTRLRLLRFIQAACDGQTNLLLAALEAGFGSYSQCHRTFHQTLGCSPSRYFRADVRARMEHAVLPFER